jgi:thiopeptide-type bacteriocin biosynthesis protein
MTSIRPSAMESVKKQGDWPRFHTSGFFVLRAPLLPFDDLLAWSGGLEAPSSQAAPHCLDGALARDAARLQQRLRALTARPEVREALFVASPSLDDRFHVWLERPESDQGQKIERSLVKYFARMAGRATPFGLLAGCAVGSIAKETRLTVAPRCTYRRHARLDMNCRVALVEILDRDRDARQALTYRPNSSLYRMPGRIHYREYRRTDKGRVHYAVSLVESAYLQALLARAQEGATIRQLADALIGCDPAASLEEAEQYVHELIDRQVLVSELAPCLTGPEANHGLVPQLLRGSAAASVATRLVQVQRDLHAINAEKIGLAPHRYRSVARVLEDLPAHLEPDRLFQVDMTIPGGGLCLGQSVTNEILRGVEILHRLGRPSPEQEELARFRQAFAQRYLGQTAPPYATRWLPLVSVVDEELGIGLGEPQPGLRSSLLDGLEFPLLLDSRVPWSMRDRLLLGKLHEAIGQGCQQIVLEKGDLEEMALSEPLPLPDAFAAMVSLSAVSEKALNGGAFQICFERLSGPSGANLLGRFCHADPVLRQHVEQHLRAEEALQPDAIFAEIVHLPEEGRIGNVLARPRLREYELVYLGQSGAPVEKQIPMTDLLVTVSGNEILLRSRRLGRRVIPRLTSAHKFSARARGLYRFLCLLQVQNTSLPGWNWGPLEQAPFLPRVVCGKLVLARARWLLTQKELKTLGSERGTERFRQAQELRGRLRWPRWVVLADDDHALPLDLDNVLSVETLVGLVKGSTGVVVQEMFPGPDQLCAGGPEGRFVHQLIVPFVRARAATAAPESQRLAEPASFGSAGASPCRRSFPPGSEWLYAKFYTGPGIADEFLRDVIRPVTDAVLRSGALDRWFFIRYADPNFHLRLRFHGAPRRLLNEVLPELQLAAAPFVEDGRVWRVQLDTYEREVERYGGQAGIELAEQVFQADSEAVLALANLLVEDARGDVRWRLSLLGMELLLDDLGLELQEKQNLLCGLRDSFAREFHAGVNLRRQLGSKYRAQRRSLEAVFGSSRTKEDFLARGWAVFQRRSEKLAPMMAELRDRERAGRLTLPRAKLAADFLHMHANRMLRCGHRAQEVVLYEFLFRLYDSQAARQASTQHSAEAAATRTPVLAGEEWLP